MERQMKKLSHLPEKLCRLIEEARKAAPSTSAALTGLHSLDLTSLNDTDSKESIEALIAKTDQGKHGKVAATCVYPKFLSQTFNGTAAKNIARATVINFPDGKSTPEQTIIDTKNAIAAGANEIDIVLDHESFLKGDVKKAEDLLHACRAACGEKARLKVILESALFEDYLDLRNASLLALDCGADFIKTSTGKSPEGGASLEAAATMLEAIIDRGGKAGLKVSGGVKTVTDCAQYIDLTQSMMGKDWISLQTFRIGASSVLTDIMQYLEPTTPKPVAAPQTQAVY